MTAQAIKHDHKPTATTPSTIIAAAYNHFLPLSDDDNDNDADPADLMVNYDSGGKKKGKGGHRCRYRDDDNIEALRGLYEEPKDDDDDVRCDNDDDNGDWDDMEEKEREEENDDGDDVVDITTVQFFGMPDEELFR